MVKPERISFTFGTPKYGWLPVDFHYQNFHVEFEASDCLNDPIDELFKLVTKIEETEFGRITWWLEPEAYFFDFKKKGQDFTLTIIETDDIHNQNGSHTQLITLTGNYTEIIEPFRTALKHFYSQTYEETQWQYCLDKNQIL